MAVFSFILKLFFFICGIWGSGRDETEKDELLRIRKVKEELKEIEKAVKIGDMSTFTCVVP